MVAVEAEVDLRECERIDRRGGADILDYGDRVDDMGGGNDWGRRTQHGFA